MFNFCLAIKSLSFFVYNNYNNYIINNNSDKKIKSTNGSASLTVTRSKCVIVSDVFK
jgi:hypothetical protein